MTRDEAIKDLRELYDMVGGGFHLDTRFEDYVLSGSGERSYDDHTASVLNARLDAILEVLDEEAYSLCADWMYEDLNEG